MKYELGKKIPKVASSAYIAPGAHVIGDVILEEESSVWFNAVLRADNAPIVVGAGSNIQDGSVLHVDDDMPINIGENVTIGHKVMLHGCEIGACSLIGINSVVLNGAKIGKYCIIGANTLVSENKEIPDGSLVIGSPGKVIKTLSKDQQALLEMSAKHYKQKAKFYCESLTAVE